MKSAVPDCLVLRRRGGHTGCDDAVVAADEIGHGILDTERPQTPDSESVPRIFVEPLDPTRNWGKCFHG